MTELTKKQFVLFEQFQAPKPPSLPTKIEQFTTHCHQEVQAFLEDFQNSDEHYDKHEITITYREKSLQIPMWSDNWDAFETFLETLREIEIAES